MIKKLILQKPLRLLQRFTRAYPVVSVLKLSGVIAASSRIQSSLNIGELGPNIELAFRQRHLAAVALIINCPGGSPAQSSLIFQRIRDLSEEKEIPVIAFVEDVAASGGYWLACAADEIFANDSSIIGSIGVVSAGFGFAELIAKLGIERRLHSQGGKKTLLDPFMPEKPGDVQRLTTLQKDIFEVFKNIIKSRRGDKLNLSERQAFSGEVWLGRRALDHGFIDGIGDLHTEMRKRFGKQVRFKILGTGGGLLSRLMRRRFGNIQEPSLAKKNWAEQLISAIEVQTFWSRFGL